MMDEMNVMDTVDTTTTDNMVPEVVPDSNLAPVTTPNVTEIPNPTTNVHEVTQLEAAAWVTGSTIAGLLLFEGGKAVAKFVWNKGKEIFSGKKEKKEAKKTKKTKKDDKPAEPVEGEVVDDESID